MIEYAEKRGSMCASIVEDCINNMKCETEEEKRKKLKMKIDFMLVKEKMIEDTGTRIGIGRRVCLGRS